MRYHIVKNMKQGLRQSKRREMNKNEEIWAKRKRRVVGQETQN